MISAGRDGSILSVISRDSWDDKILRRLVSDENNCFVASNTHISTVGHITQREFTELFRPRDLFSGDANRREYFLCERRQRVREYEWTEEEHAAIVAERDRLARECSEHLKASKQWLDSLQRPFSNDGVEFRLDASARAEMRTFLDFLDGFLESSPLDNLFSRAEQIVLRTALVEAVLDRSRNVSAKHIKTAIAIWQYGRESAERIFVALEQTKAAQGLDAFHARLLRWGRPIKVGEAQKFKVKPYLTSEEVRRAFDMLASENPPRGRWSEEKRHSHGGRSYREFTALNPNEREVSDGQAG
jgi:hypothetical protein